MNWISKIFFIGILFSLASIDSYSLKNIQVIVKGKVIDEYTGKPTEAQIEFKTSSGNKFKIKSNSLDGTFSQVFAAGESVDATFTNFDLIKTTTNFKVEDADKFKEVSKDFTVKKLTPGLVAFPLNGFNKGEKELLAESKSTIQKLEEIMNFNRNVKFEISVNAHDTYSKTVKVETKKASKKGKKSTTENVSQQTIIEPPQDAIKSLVDLRLKEVENLIKGFKKFQNRITISPDFSAGPIPNESNGQNSTNNLKVIVKEIKNQLE